MECHYAHYYYSLQQFILFTYRSLPIGLLTFKSFATLLATLLRRSGQQLYNYSSFTTVTPRGPYTRLGVVVLKRELLSRLIAS